MPNPDLDLFVTTPKGSVLFLLSVLRLVFTEKQECQPGRKRKILTSGKSQLLLVRATRPMPTRSKQKYDLHVRFILDVKKFQVISGVLTNFPIIPQII